LFDLLIAIGITPDLIIGHSIGEFACAYADGCLTAEQALKTAYYCGLAVLNSKISLGAMANVGLGYNQIKDILPINVEVACHSSQNNCTISGLKESVEQFVLKLKSKDISTQIINLLNTPYHTKFIGKAIPLMVEYLKKVIPNPKLRSEKWISTSVPEENWSENIAKYCSAEYCANNLLNHVLFDETLKHISNGSILVELSPHGILQDTLDRSFKKNITSLDLVSKNNDGLGYLLSAIGK
jgi:fatty acid synthase